MPEEANDSDVEMVVHKTVTNSDAESEAPKIKTAIPEDFDQPNEDEVSEFGNAEAPRYSKGEAQLTPNAIRCRAKRIFTPRVDGSKKVSDTIFKEWQQKGAARKNLEEIFKQCGYDAESCHIVFCSDSRVYSIRNFPLRIMTITNHFLEWWIQSPSSQDTFVAEVEVLRSQMQSQEFEIEAEFLTHAEMVEKGLSESISYTTCLYLRGDSSL